MQDSTDPFGDEVRLREDPKTSTELGKPFGFKKAQRGPSGKSKFRALVHWVEWIWKEYIGPSGRTVLV